MKICQANGPQKQAVVAILISDKVDFKLVLVKPDTEGHFLLIKWAKHQKEIASINLYACNVSAPNFIKHTLKDVKAHIDSNTVVEGHFNTPLSQIGKLSRQKVNKEILEVNDNIEQIDLSDVYRICHPARAQYTFFSAVHGTFYKT
jgi:hypothetical protein